MLQTTARPPRASERKVLMSRAAVVLSSPEVGSSYRKQEK
jgi:hypothetical protein